MKRTNIGFIGAGNMARAMVKGMCACSKLYRISASDVSKKALNIMCRNSRVKKASSNGALVKKAGTIILAVKPQNIQQALLPLKGTITKKHLIVSIASGVTIKKIQEAVGMKIPVVRVMPNTPALVGEGACGYSASREVTAKDNKFAASLLRTFCRVVIKLPEKDINMVTALSGSGPAYFFYFAEAMADAAVSKGFSRAKASELIAQTLAGSGKLLIESGEKPESLRKKVTSKGGTTEAAIKTMNKMGIKNGIKQGVIAAKKRADRLGK